MRMPFLLRYGGGIASSSEDTCIKFGMYESVFSFSWRWMRSCWLSSEVLEE